MPPSTLMQVIAVAVTLLNNPDSQACYVFFQGKYTLYYSKYSLLTGHVSFERLSTLDYLATIEGAFLSNTVYLYIQLVGQPKIQEFKLDTENNTFSTGHQFSTTVLLYIVVL